MGFPSDGSFLFFVAAQVTRKIHCPAQEVASWSGLCLPAAAIKAMVRVG
jgi:hypothetical protein